MMDEVSVKDTIGECVTVLQTPLRARDCRKVSASLLQIFRDNFECEERGITLKSDEFTIKKVQT